MKLFSLEKVTKVFGHKKVLDIDKLDFAKGVTYALLGPNGAGKTTLLEILAFLSFPSSGHMRFRENEVSFSSRELEALRKRVVMVHQQPVLFSTTVYKNVEFGLKVRGVSGKQRREIVARCLETVGMRHAAHSYAKTLSGGEKQRVAIARALACSPEALLLDEPTASVDPENQVVIERIIAEINALKGISVIFTTHDIRQAGKAAGRIVYLYEGRALSSPLENIFSAVLEGDGTGQARCLLKGGIQFKVNTQVRGEAKISIDPRRILLRRGERCEQDGSIFEGRVTGLDTHGISADGEEPGIRVEVEIGVPVSVFMEREKAKKIGVFVGDRVLVKIPNEAIRIF